MIENNTKNSMLMILRMCFFSRPRIAYNANSLLRFFSKKISRVHYENNCKKSNYHSTHSDKFGKSFMSRLNILIVDKWDHDVEKHQLIPDDNTNGISKILFAFKFWKANFLAIENVISYHLDSAWIEPDLYAPWTPLVFRSHLGRFRDKRCRPL